MELTDGLRSFARAEISEVGDGISLLHFGKVPAPTKSCREKFDYWFFITGF